MTAGLPTADPSKEKASTGKLIWRLVRLSAGWALLILGIIGLFLPVLQGLVFIASGLALLSADLPWAKRLLEHFSRWRARRLGSRRPPDSPTPPNGSNSPPNAPF
ncbi:MAG: PGPGW domain-containing protein [Acidobacteria bacterium]|nr:PGPGW domain-containing protein [Acidobacteriota bacterium]